jgi:hypothetical protein
VAGAEVGDEDLSACRLVGLQCRAGGWAFAAANVSVSHVSRFRHKGANAVWQGSLVDMIQPDVGRQCNNRIRIPVQESCLAPNIGLEELQNRAWSEVSKTHSCICG